MSPGLPIEPGAAYISTISQPNDMLYEGYFWCSTPQYKKLGPGPAKDLLSSHIYYINIICLIVKWCYWKCASGPGDGAHTPLRSPHIPPLPIWRLVRGLDSPYMPSKSLIICSYNRILSHLPSSGNWEKHITKHICGVSTFDGTIVGVHHLFAY